MVCRGPTATQQCKLGAQLRQHVGAAPAASVGWQQLQPEAARRRRAGTAFAAAEVRLSCKASPTLQLQLQRWLCACPNVHAVQEHHSSDGHTLSWTCAIYCAVLRRRDAAGEAGGAVRGAEGRHRPGARHQQQFSHSDSAAATAAGGPAEETKASCERTLPQPPLSHAHTWECQRILCIVTEIRRSGSPAGSGCQRPVTTARLAPRHLLPSGSRSVV